MLEDKKKADFLQTGLPGNNGSLFVSWTSLKQHIVLDICAMPRTRGRKFSLWVPEKYYET